jgi:hypothetical protein
MMPVTEQIESLVLDNRSAGEIRRVAMNQGMKSLREDGWRLIHDGRTTLEEVLRVTKDERASLNGTAGTGNGKSDAREPSGPKVPRRGRPTVSVEDVAADSAEETITEER